MSVIEVSYKYTVLYNGENLSALIIAKSLESAQCVDIAGCESLSDVSQRLHDRELSPVLLFVTPVPGITTENAGDLGDYEIIYLPIDGADVAEGTDDTNGLKYIPPTQYGRVWTWTPPSIPAIVNVNGGAVMLRLGSAGLWPKFAERLSVPAADVEAFIYELRTKGDRIVSVLDSIRTSFNGCDTIGLMIIIGHARIDESKRKNV